MRSLILITGHSQGLGKALTTLFLDRDTVEVVGISRRKSGLNHSNLTEISLDFSDLVNVRKILPSLFPKRKYHKVILVNNAAWIGSVKPLQKQSIEDIERVNSINYLVPAMLCRQFLSESEYNDSEKIICNISSGLAYRPESGLSGYCATKASLAMLSEVLALENHPKTHVFSLAPGVIDTAMQLDLRSADEVDFPKRQAFENLKSSGSLQSSIETAKKILYLLDNPERFNEVVQDVRKY